MIRENNVTVEYELAGEKVYITRDEDGIVDSIINNNKIISWKYDTRGNISNVVCNFKMFSIPVKKWIRENLRYILHEGKLISYTIELDKLGLIVTLDSDDKIIKIKEFEYEYDYNDKGKECNLIIKNTEVNITNELEALILRVLRLNKEERKDPIYNKFILNRVKESEYLDKLYKGYVNTENLNNFTFNNKPDMRGNIIPKDSHFGRLSQILYNQLLKINTEGGDKMSTNKSKIDLEEIEREDKIKYSPDEFTGFFKDQNKNKESKDGDKIEEILFLDNLRDNREELIDTFLNKYGNYSVSEISKDIDNKSKYSPDEFPGFFKDPNKNKESKVMLSDLFKLEKAIQVIKLLEEDYSSSFSLNEIKEIALNSTIFDKYGKDNFSIGIFNRDCVQKIITSKNVKVTTVLDKDNDCTIGYYDNITQSITVHPDFNINKKYAFLIDNTTSKSITLLLYIPSHFPITHSDDVMRIIKEYGLE